MKKSIFTLTLLATLLFCGCDGALDTKTIPEEPLIRAGGIVDRIYVKNKETPEMKLQCMMNIKGKILKLTFNEKTTFTVSLYNNDTEELIFAQLYTGTDKCTIDLLDFPNGDYTLYVNEEAVFQFTFNDDMGGATEEAHVEIIPWEEIIRNARNVPRDVYTIETTTSIQGMTSIVLSGFFSTLNICKEPFFTFDESNNSEPAIVDIGMTSGIANINTLPKEGWGDKAAILPLHGYFVRCRPAQYDGTNENNYMYLRLYVLKFGISEEDVMHIYLQFQTLNGATKN